MKPSHHEQIIIVGCGRVGAEMAQSISRRGAPVTVIDTDPRAFDRLGMDYHGRRVQGDALDRDALERAGIANAHGLAAVTASDSANIVVARVAQDVYKVEHVVARVYDPTHASLYETLGLQTIATTTWGAQRMEQMLLHPGLRSVFVAGNGQVQIYEIVVPEQWDGQRLADLLPAGEARAVALTRGGRGQLPASDTIVHAQDILQVSATADGAATVRAQMLALAKE